MRIGRAQIATFLRADGRPDRQFTSSGLDALATAVLYLDPDLAVRYANPAAENLFKVSSRNILSHALSEVFPNTAPLTNAIRQAVERNSTYVQHELQLTTAAQEKLEVSCTVIPCEIDGFEGYLLEFTEVHQQL